MFYKKLRFLYLVFLSHFFFFSSFAQRRANVWYFGFKAGIDFNASLPVAIESSMITGEGCASISDQDGKLLFYTDGSTVWDTSQTQMPNGIGLKGGSSSGQSALIVPKPGNSSIYYIFTTSDMLTSFCYSIVDMTKNGGMGDVDVATKNITLLDSVTEKLTAVHHANMTDIWVVTHEWNTDAFYAYLVTNSGIQSPVISNVGTVHKNNMITNWNSIGYMKASPDGKKLGLAIRDMNLFEVFDFDNLTGKVSGAISLPSPDQTVYGVEFSPDGTKFYGTAMTSSTLGPGKLFQYNLQAGSAVAIKNSVVSIPVTLAVRGIQLAPDCRIYVVGSSQNIGVIANPNLSGVSCNYSDNGFTLKSGTSASLGLPAFIQSYFGQSGLFKITLGNDTSICEGDTIKLTPDNKGSSCIWSNGSTASSLSVTSPGSYWIKVSGSCGADVDTINVNNKDCSATVKLSPPNIITPNNDGINDVFFVGMILNDWELLVYNRWGRLIYSAIEYKNDWNALGLPDGVYYYLLTNSKKSSSVYNGYVQVIHN